MKPKTDHGGADRCASESARAVSRGIHYRAARDRAAALLAELCAARQDGDAPRLAVLGVEYREAIDAMKRWKR